MFPKYSKNKALRRSYYIHWREVHTPWFMLHCSHCSGSGIHTSKWCFCHQVSFRQSPKNSSTSYQSCSSKRYRFNVFCSHPVTPVPSGHVPWVPQLSTRLAALLSPAPLSLPGHVVEEMLGRHKAPMRSLNTPMGYKSPCTGISACSAKTWASLLRNALFIFSF